MEDLTGANDVLQEHRTALELLADRLCEHHYADSKMLREWLVEQLPGVS